jgi:hypothetical protein
LVSELHAFGPIIPDSLGTVPVSPPRLHRLPQILWSGESRITYKNALFSHYLEHLRNTRDAHTTAA